jgi:hypothetical protein
MSESWKTINDLNEKQKAVADEKLRNFDAEILPGTPITNDAIFSESVRKANEEKLTASYRVGTGRTSDPTYVENLARAEEILNGRDFEFTADEVVNNEYTSRPIKVEDNQLSAEQIQKAEEALIGSKLTNAKLITMEDIPRSTSPHDRIGKDAIKPTPQVTKKSFLGRLFGG